MNVPINVTLTGSDPDTLDVLTAVLVEQPIHGTLNDINQNTGLVTYTPNPSFIGDDRFTVKVNDGKQDSNIATVKIRVSGG